MSCLTNLLGFLKDITHSDDRHCSVDVVLWIFKIYLNNVPHERSPIDMEGWSIGGKLLPRVKTWLCNKTQRLVLRDCAFSWRKQVTNSVPQGLVLQPLSFTFEMNDRYTDILARV
ncbi:hypothetical protein HOLleu_44109 [Holothuria leucospilota]|uniref:Reverse transcriptase domain-containing protein n=1 Tax=Holothuria leucospilota TaxID=206669 RepID=A0A9Q0YG75_HOLLE|nr:hypothetical protein HOLleu_44109 [Holothuria leucospilota]